jgi:hypothetical protein
MISRMSDLVRGAGGGGRGICGGDGDLGHEGHGKVVGKVVGKLEKRLGVLTERRLSSW